MNSVFGAVFQPQGAAMIALNDWPARPITATNHVAFENLTWVDRIFRRPGLAEPCAKRHESAVGHERRRRVGVPTGASPAPASTMSRPRSRPCPTSPPSTPAQFNWDAIGQPARAARAIRRLPAATSVFWPSPPRQADRAGRRICKASKSPSHADGELAADIERDARSISTIPTAGSLKTSPTSSTARIGKVERGSVSAARTRSPADRST